MRTVQRNNSMFQAKIAVILIKRESRVENKFKKRKQCYAVSCLLSEVNQGGKLSV